jgi:cation:H+ antiporter
LIFVLVFAIAGIALFFAGSALARQADAIADQTGVGKVWIGATLLAAATSLPEIVTDLAAVRLGALDLAVGDLFGSSMANMFIFAVVDLMATDRPWQKRELPHHVLAASLAITLSALAAAFTLLRPAWTLAGVSPFSVLLLAVYVAGSRAMFVQANGSGEGEPVAARTSAGTKPLRRLWIRFLVAAAVVLGAAPWFAWSANGIAEITGLGGTFVGTTLVGISTSFPEMVASIAAVRLGSFGMAAGNLFGSNAFNMAIFVILDLAHPHAGIFAALDPFHAVSASMGLVLMGLGLAAMVHASTRRLSLVQPGGLVMIAAYLAGIALLYFHGAGGM